MPCRWTRTAGQHGPSWGINHVGHRQGPTTWCARVAVAGALGCASWDGVPGARGGHPPGPASGATLGHRASRRRHISIIPARPQQARPGARGGGSVGRPGGHPTNKSRIREERPEDLKRSGQQGPSAPYTSRLHSQVVCKGFAPACPSRCNSPANRPDVARNGRCQPARVQGPKAYAHPAAYRGVKITPSGHGF